MGPVSEDAIIALVARRENRGHCVPPGVRPAGAEDKRHPGKSEPGGGDEGLVDRGVNINPPLFGAADQEFRQRRIAHVEALRAEGGTETARWAQRESHRANWGLRGIELAGLVKPGERVFEFGAGISHVAAALPEGCSYCGSDVAPLAPEVVVFDLNAPVLAPIKDFDVALFSGVLEYVHDLPRLLDFLFRSFRSVIASYAPRMTESAAEIEVRRYSGWFNDHSRTEIEGLFTAAGFVIASSGAWKEQLLYRFDRSR